MTLCNSASEIVIIQPCMVTETTENKNSVKVIIKERGTEYIT